MAVTRKSIRRDTFYSQGYPVSAMAIRFHICVLQSSGSPRDVEKLPGAWLRCDRLSMLQWTELTWDCPLDNLIREENVYLLEFSRVPKELDEALLGDNELLFFKYSDFSQDTRLHTSGAKVFIPREIYQDVCEVLKDLTFLQSRHVVVSERFIELVRRIVYDNVPANRKTYEKQKKRTFLNTFSYFIM